MDKNISMNAQEAHALTQQTTEERVAQWHAEAHQRRERAWDHLDELEVVINTVVAYERRVIDGKIQESASKGFNVLGHTYERTYDDADWSFFRKVGDIVAGRLVAGLCEDGYQARIFDSYHSQSVTGLDQWHDTTDIRVAW